MRQAIGALMARSKKEIPHYYLQTTVDLDHALTWLEAENAQRGVGARILPAALLLKAAALAARAVPDMNGFFVDGTFTPSEHVHLGVAVSLRGGGLVAPALHDTDQLPLPELMERLKELVARARSGRLTGSQMSDPTLTVTNLGDQGVEAVHGVIYPPQVALVGFGRVLERPWAVGGMLTVRRVLVATLAADHRVSDGHLGARYLSALDAALQKPEEL
jgi:pyruvate dehydrogenase E2 component (dihydrolipoamide acetyltransferase)